MSETTVKGLADLQKFLDQLPAKMEANVMRGALRAGMKPILTSARDGAAKLSGEMSKGLKIGTRIKYGRVYAILRTSGKHGFLANWSEYGTAAHRITAKNRKGLTIGGLLFQSVEHPGAKAQPFMRPALDEQAQNAVLAAAEYIKARLAKKHGLDTAHIEIESGE
jgi:HK97 gp10 family phage protein